MQVSVITAPAGMARWNLVLDYMSLRREVFIGKKRWDLRSDAGLEFEQYDAFQSSTYVLVHDGETVHAGCRLMRTDTTIGTGRIKYSYMIRDAYLGLIDLPSELCDEEPPADDKNWELTRLVSRGVNREASLRCMYGAYDYLLTLGASGCLCLGSPAIMRLARISGFKPRPLGRICRHLGDPLVAFALPLGRQE